MDALHKFSGALFLHKKGELEKRAVQGRWLAVGIRTSVAMAALLLVAPLVTAAGTLAPAELSSVSTGECDMSVSAALMDAQQDVLDRAKVEPEAGQPIVIAGRVVDPDGRSAMGALVVSSSGGLSTVDEIGAFRLELRVPPGTQAVQVTAVGSGDRSHLSASRQVSGLVHGGITPAGTLALQAVGGCQPSWLPTFGETPGTDNFIFSLAAFDDGNGTALYASGNFQSAGNAVASSFAKWDGTHWSALGSGTSIVTINALAVFDDGTGPALYAAGEFSSIGGVAAQNIAKWNGTSWSPLGSGLSAMVETLGVFDDGNGPALYAGGNFMSAGGVAAIRIARWNGTSWSALGTGTSNWVRALAVFDDGSGPALYVGGDFFTAGGVTVNQIAKWDGTSWSSLSGGLNGGGVWALTVFDDGSGPALIAGGFFTASAAGAAASRIAKWDGTSWSALGSGMDDVVYALAAFDDGNGAALYAGGRFTSAGGAGASRIARWDGTSWSSMGSGMNDRVVTFAIFDDGSGPALYPGGYFTFADGVAAKHIARWDGVSLSALTSGIDGGVWCLTVFDDGNGPALYVGGPTGAGGVAFSYIARWDGTSWSPLGSGTNFVVAALEVFDDGGGPALYAGGYFTIAGGVSANRIAKWNGTSWSALGSGMNQAVRALVVFDDGSGPALYAGGAFTNAAGVPGSHRVVRWNGTSWSALGGGMNDSVVTLTVFDDGSGAALYAGGYFTFADGLPAYHIAKWNGTAWSPLGTGMNNIVWDLAVFDDGSGPALCAGGYFTDAGGVAANYVAKWNGASWSALGSGMNNYGVSALAVFNDGGGSALFAGGSFTSAGGVAANDIAKWNGTAWSPLGSGMNGGVGSFAVFDDGTCSGAALFVGGGFASAIDSHDSFLAKWGCAAQFPTPGCPGAFCFGDGLDPNVTTPCPCGNFGSAGRGCASSANSSGALLAASGTTNPDTMVLAGSGMPATVACVYLQGDALDDTPFGDGVRCAGGNLIRLRTKINAGGASQFPDGTDTVTLSQRGGVTPGSGAVRYYQTYYRNAAAAFCPPATSNVTSGWVVVW